MRETCQITHFSNSVILSSIVLSILDKNDLIRRQRKTQVLCSELEMLEGTHAARRKLSASSDGGGIFSPPNNKNEAKEQIWFL